MKQKGGYPFWFDDVPKGMSRKKYLSLEKKKPKHKTMKKWIQKNKDKEKKRKKTQKKHKNKTKHGGFSIKRMWNKAFKTTSLDENDYLNREEVLIALQKMIMYDSDILIEYLIFFSLPKKQQNIIKKRYKNEGIDIQLWEHPDHIVQTNYRISLPYFLATGEEKHPLKEYNFCGPGTKHDLRLHQEYWPLYPLFMKLSGLNIKGTYPWNEPINNVDFCCSQHDMKYGLVGNTPEDIRSYDREMLYCIDNSYHLDNMSKYTKNKLIKGTINSKITAEKIGLLKKGSYGANLLPVENSQDNFSSNQETFIKRLEDVLQNADKYLQKKNKYEKIGKRIAPIPKSMPQLKSHMYSSRYLY
jgi:hypothetical protein